MLSIMRKQAGSWIIKVILFAIVVVFIFWGVGSFRSGQKTKLAEINGETIGYETYRQAYERLREQYTRAYGSIFTEDMLKGMNLEQQALDQVVNRVLMLQEAQRLDIQVPDGTLDEAIVKIPAFQKDGVYDEQRANFFLQQNRISTAQFRNSFREDMVLEKLRSAILDGIIASESEARAWYDWSNAEVNLDYVQFPKENYTNIELTDEDVAKFYESNKDNYRTEQQVKVRYLFFDPDTFKDKVNVTKEQISEYYYSHPEEFRNEKTVEARHILIKVDEKADPKLVDEKKQKAMEIYNLAQSGEPFDELAKKYSEGPTREQGGYLGSFKRDAMVKPFADKAFAMKAGEISEPVRTKFGWHVIKVEKVNEALTQSLEASSDTIREKLIEAAARKMALEKAEEFYGATYDGDDLAAVAKTHDLPVETTDFFSKSGLKDAKIGNTRQFTDTAFALKEMAVSEILDLEKGYFLIQVVERKSPEVPPLDKVRDKVTADLTETRKEEMAGADAKACLEAVSQGKSISEAADGFKLVVEQTGFFKRSGTIPQLGYQREISEAAFELKAESPLADKPFKTNLGWVVIRLKEKKSPEEQGFDNEKERIVDRLAGQKKQAAFQQWLADLRGRGDVKVNKKLIQ